jgi:hypothetical protein
MEFNNRVPIVPAVQIIQTVGRQAGPFKSIQHHTDSPLLFFMWGRSRSSPNLTSAFFVLRDGSEVSELEISSNSDGEDLAIFAPVKTAIEPPSYRRAPKSRHVI